jgi:uncharacterized membrane protein
LPFTFSHPALILPFRLLPRKWTSLTGLVVGSITPDFEKFIKMEPGNTFSHTWHGLFWFNIPLGILLAFLFHGMIRNHLVNNLPLILKSRLIKFLKFKWIQYFSENYLVVLSSLFIGALTHIIWDSFTHQKGAGVLIIQSLSYKINLWGYDAQIFQLLDYGSSLIGVILLFYMILKISPTEKKVEICKNYSKYWIMISAIAVLIVLMRILMGLDITNFWDSIFTIISAGIIALILTSCFMKYFYK